MKDYLDDVMLMYNYCMKEHIQFSFTESEQFVSVLFKSEKSDKLFSYTWNKEDDKLLRLVIDDTIYDDVELALKDFEEYDLLGKN